MATQTSTSPAWLPPSLPSPAAATMSQPHKDTTQDRPTSSALRHAKQFGLFMAGAGFLAASVAVTRRAVLRQRAGMLPAFYISNRAPIKVTHSDRQLLAAHALGLASLNVMSFGIMLVGGISWGFDISSIEELRRRTKTALDRPSGYSPEEEKEAEEEMEKAMEGLMARLGMKMPEVKEGGQEEGGLPKEDGER